jgi:quercetin dioxygenase-like cupin family protein
MMRHIRWNEVPEEQLSPMLTRRYVNGAGVTVARFVLRQGLVVPEHSHPNEQVTCILEGALKFTLEGREVVVRAGETLVIPPNLPHAAEALEDTLNLDVFTPPRADWEQKHDQYLRG